MWAKIASYFQYKIYGLNMFVKCFLHGFTGIDLAKGTTKLALLTRQMSHFPIHVPLCIVLCERTSYSDEISICCFPAVLAEK